MSAGAVQPAAGSGLLYRLRQPVSFKRSAPSSPELKAPDADLEHAAAKLLGADDPLRGDDPYPDHGDPHPHGGDLDLHGADPKGPPVEVPFANLPLAEAPSVEVPFANLPFAEAPPGEVAFANLPLAEAPPVEMAPVEVPFANLPFAEAPPVEVPFAEAAFAEPPFAEAPPVDTPRAEVDAGVETQTSLPEPTAVVAVPAQKAGRKRRGGGRAANLVGLAIEPGLIVAAKSHVNGHVVVERAAFTPLALDVFRDGEANDVPALVDALSDLFKSSKLERRVRIGIANQKIMMRRLELPPLTDAKDIQQAVFFQAQDEIPMPLESVVLDYHTLGVSEGPQGPRLHVLLVAARKDMIARIVEAARLAGLQPDGVDLAAFGMIRALRPADAGPTEQILYLAIGGLTNLAISRGSVCEFTRVVTWGVEQIASEVASRCAITLDDARRLLISTDASEASAASQPGEQVAPLAPSLPGIPAPVPGSRFEQPFASPGSDGLTAPPDAMVRDHVEVARDTLSEGIRRIASEVRHSLDFYLAAQPDVPVTRAVLCGPALEIPGFALTLSRELGLTVMRGEVELASAATGNVPASVLPVAAGLSLAEGAA